MNYRFAGEVGRIAVGQRPNSVLALQPGQTVPGNERFVLHEQLSASSAREVWRAQNGAGELRIFKFAVDSDGLRSLKREWTLARILVEALGPRPDMVGVPGSNFATPPFHLESEYGGKDLLRWSEDGLGAPCWRTTAR